MKSIKANKTILFTIAANLLLLLMTFLYAFTRPSVNLSFSPEELSIHWTSADGNELQSPGAYLDSSVEGSGKYISTPFLTLAKGIYHVTVQYQTNNPGTDFCKTWAVSDSSDYNALLCDHVPLYRTDTQVQYHMYLNQSSDQIYIKCILLDGSPSYISVENIHISSSNMLYALQLMMKAVFLLGIFDILVWLVLFRKHTFHFTPSGRIVVFGITCVSLLASIPLFSDYLIEGHDLTFHLMRIEGLKNGLMSLSLPVRIQPGWLENHGYPVSVFYGDLLLYFPALLRISGIPLQTVYKIFLLLVNLATAWVSYVCFAKMSKNKYIGLCGSILYTLNPYRLTDIYIRSSVGEFSAMIFLPVILYGIWKIYTEEDSAPAYKNNWLIPVIGFSGIIQTHIITCEMVGFFTLLTCLLFIKRTLKKQTFMVLFKTLLITLLVNAWFLIPFFSMFGEAMNVHVRESEARIQGLGAFPFQLFAAQYGVSGLSVDASLGAVQEFPLSIGLGLSVCLLLFCLYFVMKKSDFHQAGEKCALLFSILTLLLSTTLFPYDILSTQSRLLERIFSSIQFPWRFLTLSVLFISWAACLVLVWIRKSAPSHAKIITFSLVLFLSILSGSQCLQLSGQITNEMGPYRIYDNEPLIASSVGHGEYLIAGTDYSQLFSTPSTDGAVNVLNFSQAYNRITLSAENPSNAPGYVDVPLLYYKGYLAVDEGTGQKMEIGYGDNNRVRISLPEGYNGTVTVRYAIPLLWRISELISLLCISFILFFQHRIRISSVCPNTHKLPTGQSR